MEDYNEEIQSTSTADESDRIPSHFLVELTSLDELAFPANSTKRVKYTCVASTSRSLILGTSTGTVYIFSRYAAKSRSRQQAPVPVHVFTTRDGQINTISLASSEELMAIGGDSGRVSVAQMNSGQSPTLLYTISGDARNPDKVTALGWSNDCKQVFSGHSSGNILVHRLGNRSVFRASHQKLAKFDGEIIQLDVYSEHIVVSTNLAAYILHVESGTSQQIGKKGRNSASALGACYIRAGEQSGYIVAARPNGRLWESNLVGVVYRTHQFRQNKYVPRSPPISFRNAFPMENSEFDGIHPENQDVMFSSLKIMVIQDGKKHWILSAVGSRIVIVDSDSSKIVVLSELENEILDVSTCANDIFVLLADSKGLRKFTVFEKSKAIEKLHLKSLFLQSAQLISFCYPFSEFPPGVISKTIDGLSQMSKKKETEKLYQNLQKILDEIEERRKASESLYDNNMEQKEVSEKLASGIHRVLRGGNGQESGYDDDFMFNIPQDLRERSKSSPSKSVVEGNIGSLTSPTPIAKRASEPSNLELKNEWRKNGTPDVAEEDILQRAKMILDGEFGQKLVEKESLRTLLQLEGIQRDEIRFTPTVTIGNAAKALAELALAVPVDLSIIWKNMEENGEKDEDDEEDSGLESAKTDRERLKNRKPTIVKVVRPGVRPKPIVAVAAQNIKISTDSSNNQQKEEISTCEEMRRKQDELWLDLRLSHLKKENLENVPKSDTEDTITTTTTTTTTSITPSGGIWTNPLEESLTPTKIDRKSMENCETCGMHRSWATLALLMAVCGKVEILKMEFEQCSAIPACLDEWEKVIRWKLESGEEKEEDAICPRCETALSGIERIIADGWKNLTIVPDSTKPNNNKIFERCCQNIPQEKMKTIISRQTPPPPQDSDFPDPNFSDVPPKPINNFQIRAKVVRKTSKLQKFGWKWLKAVNLRTLLSMAIFCEGKKNVLEMISRSDKFIANQMRNQDWSAMVVMCSREVNFKNLLSFKAIHEILESVGADGWIRPKKQQIIQVGSRRSQSTSSMTSWIVDTNSKCPICALSIKMVVGGIDRGFQTYSCGHVYHKMCLATKYSIGCLACRIRARRAAAETNKLKN